MLSVISRPVTKADCVSEIILGSILFSLEDSIFDIILYPALHKLMGLNSVIDVGLSVFGIKHMLVWLNLFIRNYVFLLLENNFIVSIIKFCSSLDIFKIKINITRF